MSRFLNFPSVSSSEWKEKIIKDLKGKNYNTVISQTAEGIDIHPFYHRDNTSSVPDLSAHEPWSIRQDFFGNNAKEGNALILESLMAGVSSIGFESSDLAADLPVLLRDVIVDIIELNVITDQPEKTYLALEEICKEKGLNLDSLKGSISSDPLGDLIKKGGWSNSQVEDVQACMSQVTRVRAHDDLKCITVNGKNFTDAGADHVQTLAFTLAQANDYLELGMSHGLSVDELSKRMEFSMSLGTDFLLSASMLKALRILWKNLLSAHKAEETQAKILAYNSRWSMAPVDHHTNLLRLTSIGMSAVAGGCDRLVLNPYDNMCSSFSMRLSRNIQHLMIHEAYLDKVASPLEGAYLFGSLSKELASKAWASFKEIESQGGFLKKVLNNSIQDSIRSGADSKVAKLNSGITAWLGVNIYADKEQKEMKSASLTNQTGDICDGLPSLKFELV
jgi:methylmalonyl-CoA mutase